MALIKHKQHLLCLPSFQHGYRRHIQTRVVEEVQALWANSSAGRFRSMMTLFLRVSTSTALLTILRLPLWPVQTWPALMVTTCTSSRWLGRLRSKKAKLRHGLCSVERWITFHTIPLSLHVSIHDITSSKPTVCFSFTDHSVLPTIFSVVPTLAISLPHALLQTETSPLIAGLRENVWGLIVPTNNNSIKMSNNHCENEKQLKQLQNYESLWTTWLVVKVQIWSPAPVHAITWKEKSEWRCKYRQQTREKHSHMPTQPNWYFKIIFQFNLQVSLLKITVWSLNICCISRLVWHRLMTYLADCLLYPKHFH